jgi:hypothetical protein
MPSLHAINRRIHKEQAVAVGLLDVVDGVTVYSAVTGFTVGLLKDWEYKGKTITRDESITNFLGTFLKQLNLLDQFQGMNIDAPTIEDLVAEVRAFLIKGGYKIYFTLAAQKYFKEGSEYPSYALYLPKRTEGKFAYANTADDAKLIPFNEDVHIVLKKTAETPQTDGNEALTAGFAPASEVFSAPIFENNINDLQLP